mgnify:FL=1
MQNKYTVENLIFLKLLQLLYMKKKYIQQQIILLEQDFMLYTKIMTINWL